MELYESMNEKIADIIAIDGTPSSLYVSAYIKDLRAENAKLKEELKSEVQQAVKEFAEAVKTKIKLLEIGEDEDDLFKFGFQTLQEHLPEKIDELLKEYNND